MSDLEFSGDTWCPDMSEALNAAGIDGGLPLAGQSLDDDDSMQ